MTNLPEDWHNLLEPKALLALFRQYPPAGFTVTGANGQMPCFYTDFNLLTTLEKAMLQRLSKLPLYRIWSKWLRLSACFGGSTVTEYAPIPAGTDAATLLDDVRDASGKKSLTIIKDLPQASPLLPATDNLSTDELVRTALDRGFIEMEGQALAYVPIDFNSVEEYLGRLSAGRRKDLRRKMKKRAALTIEVRPLGDAMFFDEATLDEFYTMYLEVYAQSQIHFDCLTPEFLRALLQNGDINGIVVFYRENDALIAYNICLICKGHLVDKYIGFKYPRAREMNCYFISWLYNLEFALAHGLTAYIAGWTDPEVKASLGAQFTFTRHLVWVKNPLLRLVFRLLKKVFEGDVKALETA